MFLINTINFSLIFAVVLLISSVCVAEELSDQSYTAPVIVINEFQTGGQTAYDEFIELALISTETATISNWQLKYFSTYLSTKSCILASISADLTAGDVIVVAEKQFTNSNQAALDYQYSASENCGFSDSVLSPSKGLIVLSYIDGNGSETVVDEVAYGTAIGQLDNMPTSAPATGKSKQRILNAEGFLQDTDNSNVDFAVNDLPDPGEVPVPLHPDTEQEAAEETGEDEAPAPAENSDEETNTDTENNSLEENTTPDGQGAVEETETKTYLPIYLSELFIDPDSPLTDSNDEYVEIYNPNDDAVELAGYIVYTGANYSYKYEFKAGEKIEPKSYLSLTSGSTSLALSNSGGAARITDPDGKILDETIYQKAKTGQAWAKSADGIWIWTIKPTQDATNEILPEVLAVAAKKSASTVKKTTAKKAATTKTKKPATKKVTSVKSALDEPALIAAPTPLPNWLLASLGVLAIIYAVYEYRFEISNKIYQLKKNRANR